jgi:hypothetical protein
MKTDINTLKEIEKLLSKYEILIGNLEKDGILMKNTAKTYLLHSRNFVRWCKDDFEPGGTKKL